MSRALCTYGNPCNTNDCTGAIVLVPARAFAKCKAVCGLVTSIFLPPPTWAAVPSRDFEEPTWRPYLDRNE
eukprot:scaffold38315_cov29-Tisochrysis_lutea.AAC.5